MTLCCYGLLENSLRQGHHHGTFGGSPPAKAPAGRKRPNGKLCWPTEPAKERLYVEISRVRAGWLNALQCPVVPLRGGRRRCVWPLPHHPSHFSLNSEPHPARRDPASVRSPETQDGEKLRV